MLAKNFLTSSKKVNDKTLWMAGLGALLLLAFCVTGLVTAEENSAGDEAATSLAKVEKIKKTAIGGAEAKNSTLAPKRARRPAPPRGPGMASVWKTLSGLGIVLILLCVAAIGAAKVLKRVRLRPQGDKVLELVDAIAVGPKKQVLLVSAYGRKLIVGSSPESMNLLSEFAADEIELVDAEDVLPFDKKLQEQMVQRPAKSNFMELQA